MCRWLAYFGNPIPPAMLLVEPQNSLVRQARQERETGMPNADGFGLGWYGDREGPGLYKSVSPAWGDRNLHEIARQITARIFLGHVRAATGTPVEETNCHPFRYGRWLFVHNGCVTDWPRLRRDLLLAVDPDLFANILGSTDSEVLFHLALTFGLDDDPLGALERMAGFVEEVGRRHGVDEALQMTIGLSDGERVFAARYASGERANSLYVTADAGTVREMYPEDPRFEEFGDNARAVVSEPLGDLEGLWHELPAGSALVVQPGDDQRLEFTPRAPA